MLDIRCNIIDACPETLRNTIPAVGGDTAVPRHAAFQYPGRTVSVQGVINHMQLFTLLTRPCALSVFAFLLVGAGTSVAAGLDELLAATDDLNQDARRSQARVDKLVSETDRLQAEYKGILKQIEGLKVYNTQQRALIRNQEREQQKLGESINNVTVIERQISPLMQRMLDAIERFVELDVPFLKDERLARVRRLRETLLLSDVSVSEKFGAVLSAYQIESEYGRTIDAYSGTLPDSEKVVDFLRFGRVALVYQTTDGEESGRWNSETKTFEVLDGGYNTQIRSGIRMARKQSAVDIVVMPVSGPTQSGASGRSR